MTTDAHECPLGCTSEPCKLPEWMRDIEWDLYWLRPEVQVEWAQTVALARTLEVLKLNAGVHRAVTSW